MGEGGGVGLGVVAHLHDALESERRARADVCEMELRVALSFADTTPMPSLSARDVVVCLRDCATWYTKPRRRQRSLRRRARLRLPVLRPHRKRMRPTRHAMDEHADETTAAVRFCSCVHCSAPRKRSTQQAVSRTYL